MIINKKKIFGMLFLIVGVFFLTSFTKAATLSMKSSATSIKVGETITLGVYVDTNGKSINNTETSIKFSNNLVDVISVKGSLFSLWVEAPNFSNSSGYISLNGGFPNPGYKGSSKFLTITARAKKSGVASFSFSGAAVRENDGLGTDILSGQSGSSFTIISEESKPEIVVPKPIIDKPKVDTSTNKTETVVPDTQVSPVSSIISSPVISSNVYKIQDDWYSATSSDLTWSLPSGVTAVETLLNNEPISDPKVKYSPPITYKSVAGLTDGTWYFHLRYLINNTWSPISHYKFQVDRTAPTNLIVSSEKINSCTVTLNFSADDNLSGINYYNVKIDNREVVKVSPQDAKNFVILPPLEVGDHKVSVSAYDKAENKTDTEITINIPDYPAPKIISASDKIFTGDKISILGSFAYPKTELKVIISSDSGYNKAYDLSTDELGNFSLNSEPINKGGNYQVSISASACNGINNFKTVQTNILVEQKNNLITAQIENLGNIDYSGWPSFLIKFILFLLLIFGWYKYIIIKARLKLIKKNADKLALALLFEKSAKDLSVLEKVKKKKVLNKNEEKALDNLRKELSEIEQTVNNK